MVEKRLHLHETHTLAVRVYILDHLGCHDESFAWRLGNLQNSGPSREYAGQLAELHRREGWRAAMIAHMARSATAGNRWSVAAMGWIVLNEPQRALDFLERCVIERISNLPLMLHSPSFRPLHGDPRFRQIARTLKLDAQLDGHGDGVPTRSAAKRD